MRLTDTERQAIRTAGMRHFGRVPRPFGSRLDDSRRGGDIDLLIETDLAPAPAALRRVEPRAELWLALGERKIDVVLDHDGAAGDIVLHARRHADPV
ncbi:MAG: nucleotidyltransferase domain-containing protein [Burkholderiaceae bacterium]